MIAIISLIDIILEIYTFIIIASVVLSWLVAFNVVNTSNRIVYMIGDFLHRATEPVLAPIRRILPDTRPLDLAPLAAFIIIISLRDYILPAILF